MNALAKHTPGPWNGLRFGAITGDGDNVIVAHINEDIPEQVANALLIAAAPDMAEAMLSILALYKKDPDDLETMDKGIKLMEPVLRKAGLLS